MSALAGIFHLDGGPVEDSSLRRMSNVLSRRGSGIESSSVEGPVGLWMRSSSLSGNRSDGWNIENRTATAILAADCRLDNRDALSKILFSGRPDSDAPSDPDFLRAAYRMWGTECSDQLRGDFAFAVWDKENRRLFCTRDFAGARPFFYCYVPGRLFAFASEIAALLSLKDVLAVKDDERIADHILQINPDSRSTFYKHVRRLPAGHSLIVTHEGVRKVRYYQFDSEKSLKETCDEEYFQSFRRLFEQSVRRRLTDPSSVAFTLSGGLDSTSIAAVASRIKSQVGLERLPVFSAVFNEERDCDERSLIEPFVERHAFNSQYIVADDQTPLGILDELIAAVGEPFTAPNSSMMWMVYAAVKNAGYSAVLSGHGGDETVSYGAGYLKELAAFRQWRLLRRELRLLSKTGGGTPIRSFLNFFRYGLTASEKPSLSDRLTARALKMILKVARNHSRTEDPFAHPLSWFRPDFDSRTGAVVRLRSWTNKIPDKQRSERERHRTVLEDPLQQRALATITQIGRAHGIEMRFPFWDRDLVEYCLALPANLKLRNGMGRFVLRESMKDDLPDTIRLRRDKTNFYPNLERALLSTDRALLVESEKWIDYVAEFVVVDKVLESYRNLLDGSASPTELFAFQNILILARWLQTAF